MCSRSDLARLWDGTGFPSAAISKSDDRRDPQLRLIYRNGSAPVDTGQAAVMYVQLLRVVPVQIPTPQRTVFSEIPM
jgi:hypothetical protein